MNGAGLRTGADVLRLLSEGELASVSAADAKTHLRRGDQYLDLEQLQLGPQRADGTMTSMGNALPRKAIHEDTWRRILRQLKATPPEAPQSSPAASPEASSER
jgi:hypothetical protein